MYVYICMYVCVCIIYISYIILLITACALNEPFCGKNIYVYMCQTILLITACALNELLSEPPPNLVALVWLYSGSINAILRLC